MKLKSEKSDFLSLRGTNQEPQEGTGPDGMMSEDPTNRWVHGSQMMFLHHPATDRPKNVPASWALQMLTVPLAPFAEVPVPGREFMSLHPPFSSDLCPS